MVGKKRKQETGHQGGYALIVVMGVMFLLTLLGLMAINESVYEIRMVGNQRAHNESFFNAEVALNLAIRNFRRLDSSDNSPTTRIVKTSGSIVSVLNDTVNPENNAVGYIGRCTLSGEDIANVEVRRLFIPVSEADGSVPAANRTVSTLSQQANDVPTMSHRAYDGSMDIKRFAITATALVGGTASRTWVQKGISLPAEQNRNLF